MTTNPISGADPEAALGRLRQLAGDDQRTIYERVRLATELLDNKQWIEAVYAGSYYQAAEDIADICFSDIKRLASIFWITDTFRMFPKEKDWKRAGYSLKVMIARWQEARKNGSRPAADAPSRSAEPQTSPGAVLPTETLAQVFLRLRAENEALRQENEALRRRLDALEQVR